MRVADIRRARPPAEFSHRPGHVVKGGDEAVVERLGELRLRSGPAPHLSQRRTGYEHVLDSRRRELESSPDDPVVPLQRNECAGIEHGSAHLLRRWARSAALSSASSNGPCLPSHSWTTRIKPSARSFLRAASASHEEVGFLPAARRTARARSASNDTDNRVVFILEYYPYPVSGQGGQVPRRGGERPVPQPSLLARGPGCRYVHSSPWPRLPRRKTRTSRRSGTSGSSPTSMPGRPPSASGSSSTPGRSTAWGRSMKAPRPWTGCRRSRSGGSPS